MNSVVVECSGTRTAVNDAGAKLPAAGFDDVAFTETAASPATLAAGAGAAGKRREEKGAISRSFGSIFGSDDAADRDGRGRACEEAIRRGHCAVSIGTASDERLERAEVLLDDRGAFDVDERSQQWRGEGRDAGTATTAASARVAARTGSSEGAAAGAAVAGGDTRGLDFVEEQLKVGKRAVARGGVRVFSRIVETPVEEEAVRLREEPVDVQRRKVDRPATQADFETFEEGREMSEQAVVGKDARVAGAVEIGQSIGELDETVRGTVRRTEVDVEQLEPGAARPEADNLKP